MKKLVFLFALVALLAATTTKSYAQTLTDEEYNYVTMDLRGILNLTMTTNPQVDFVFKTIQEYRQGITKFNAVNLEVDATLAWDLFVFASSDSWDQVEAYSSNGNPVLPAEILEIKSNVDNTTGGAVEVYSAFAELLGPTLSGATLGAPAATTQFLAGAVGTTTNLGADGLAFSPGTAMNNPTTHQFRIDFRLLPDVPATFPNNGTASALAAGDYAMPGYYYLEVVYSLVEDL